MNILVVYGTRPEYLKVKNIISLGKFKSLHVKQHNDIIDFGTPDFSIELENKSNNRLNDIFSEVISKSGSIIDQFDYVLIQGDTATVAAIAITSFNCKKKIIYLESGLRTNDLKNPFPEEGYRQFVARLADIHLCPTELSRANLVNENIDPQTIHVVGNTSLDNLITIKGNSIYDDKVLITLHRNENLHIMKDWVNAILEVSLKFPNLEFIFPAHLNPIIQESVEMLREYVKVTKPMEHSELLNLLKDTKFIITDSGGLQEEASFLNKKAIVCRKTTERPEGILTNHIILCEHPELLVDNVTKVMNNFKVNNECPYGDGKSSERIIEILSKL